MKNVAILSIVLLGCLSACAQVKAPEVVQKAFKNQFPQAKSVKWGKENNTEYEAEFKMNGQSMSANYNAEGTWLETETDIKPGNLPSMVMDNVKADFNGYKMKESAKIDQPGQKGLFETELKKGDETLEILWNAQGKMMSKKPVDAD